MNVIINIQESLQMIANNVSHNLTEFAVFLQTHYSPHYFLGVVLVLMLLLIVLRKQRKTTLQVVRTPQPAELVTNHHIKNNTINMIAGEHPAATQLDLARAYIEMDKKQLAKSILADVCQRGTEQQKREANELMRNM